MGFTDSAEVTKYLGGIFATAFEDEEIAPKLKETGIVLEFKFTDPDTVIVIDMATGEVSDGSDGAPVSATMLMTADIGSAYWQGKVNLPMAMAKSKIKVEGNVASLLRLAPLGKKLFPIYVETLKRDGRDDLVVA